MEQPVALSQVKTQPACVVHESVKSLIRAGDLHLQWQLCFSPDEHVRSGDSIL
jgi:hypothetical protein